MSTREDLNLLIEKYRICKKTEQELAKMLTEYKSESKKIKSEIDEVEIQLNQARNRLETLEQEFNEKIRLKIIQLNNLKLEKIGTKDNCVDYSLHYEFLDEKYDLVKDFKIMSFVNKEMTMLDVVDLVITKHDKYGDNIFENVSKLRVVFNRYEANPEAEIKRLINRLYRIKIAQIQEEKQNLQTNYDQTSDKLTEVLIALHGKNPVKDNLLNKIFRKNQLKLQHNKTALLKEQERLKGLIEECDKKLTNKKKIELRRTCEAKVGEGLATLSEFIDFLDIFRQRANQLFACKQEYQTVKNKLCAKNMSYQSLSFKIDTIREKKETNEDAIDDIIYSIAANTDLMVDLIDLRTSGKLKQNYNEDFYSIVQEMQQKVMNVSYSML